MLDAADFSQRGRGVGLLEASITRGFSGRDNTSKAGPSLPTGTIQTQRQPAQMKYSPYSDAKRSAIDAAEARLHTGQCVREDDMATTFLDNWPACWDAADPLW